MGVTGAMASWRGRAHEEEQAGGPRLSARGEEGWIEPLIHDRAAGIDPEIGWSERTRQSGPLISKRTAQSDGAVRRCGADGWLGSEQYQSGPAELGFDFQFDRERKSLTGLLNIEIKFIKI